MSTPQNAPGPYTARGFGGALLVDAVGCDRTGEPVASTELAVVQLVSDHGSAWQIDGGVAFAGGVFADIPGAPDLFPGNFDGDLKLQTFVMTRRRWSFGSGWNPVLRYEWRLTARATPTQVEFSRVEGQDDVVYGGDVRTPEFMTLDSQITSALRTPVPVFQTLQTP